MNEQNQKFYNLQEFNPADTLPDTFTAAQLLQELGKQWGSVLPFSISLDYNSPKLLKKNGFVGIACLNPECRKQSNIGYESLLNLRTTGVACQTCKYPAVQPSLERLSRGPTDAEISRSLLNKYEDGSSWQDVDVPSLEEINGSKTQENINPEISYDISPEAKELAEKIMTTKNETVEEAEVISDSNKEELEIVSNPVNDENNIDDSYIEERTQETFEQNITDEEDSDENYEVSVVDYEEEVDLSDPNMSEENRIAIRDKFNKELYDKTKELNDELIDDLRYNAWKVDENNNIKLDVVFNLDTFLHEKIFLTCDICGTDNQWESQKEFFEDRPFWKKVDINKMNSITGKKESAHACPTCLNTIRKQNQNKYMKTLLSRLLVKYSLSINPKYELTLYSPVSTVSLLGENGENIFITYNDLMEKINKGLIDQNTYTRKINTKSAENTNLQNIKETTNLDSIQYIDDIKAIPFELPNYGKQTQSTQITETQTEVEVVKEEYIVKAIEPVQENINTKYEEKPFIQEINSILRMEQLSTDKNDSLLLEQEKLEEQLRRSKENNLVEQRVKELKEKEETKKRISEGYLYQFKDDKSNISKFNNSSFNDVIRMSLEICNKKINIEKIISKEAFNIPIIDFDVGVRVICVDYEEISRIAAVDVESVDKRIRFSFTRTKTREEYIQNGYNSDDTKVPMEYTSYYLYIDTAKFKSIQTASALAKILSTKVYGPEGMGKDKIVDTDNYACFYTTDKPSISDFERKYSTSPMGKPFGNKIMILCAIDKYRVLSTYEKMNPMLALQKDIQNLNLETSASVRYINMPLDANNANSPILYRITDYIEHSGVFVKDGIELIMSAIAQEHAIKYEFSPKEYIIEFEYDKTLFMSPSIGWYINEIKPGTFAEVPRQMYFPNGNYNPDYDKEFCFIRENNPLYRVKEQDYLRQDQRLFSPTTALSRFKHEIESENIEVKDPQSLQRFLSSIGYMKCVQPKLRVLRSSYEFRYIIERRKNSIMRINPSTIYANGVVGTNIDMNSEAVRAVNFIQAKRFQMGIKIRSKAPVGEELDKILESDRLNNLENERLEKMANEKFASQQFSRQTNQQYGFSIPSMSNVQQGLGFGMQNPMMGGFNGMQNNMMGGFNNGMPNTSMIPPQFQNFTNMQPPKDK